MTGAERDHTGDGEPGPEPGSGQFFPGTPARHETPRPQARPASALSSGANVLPMTLRGSSADLSAPVDGRVTVEDRVIGKIAALAALEAGGIAALVERAGAGGVRVAVAGEEVTFDIAVAVEYGSVVQDVAGAVKANVARVTGLMLGMRVAAVNVSVEDVRKPAGQMTSQGPGQAAARA